ncbi:GCN5 family acetyltransferase [Bradyrhizobium sp. SZCCHNRI1058]|uniref:GCN5 family acetyltransferase n=1 Tax=Bradyrhizobium sp. SZCCHNRI1058 TaxID=3057279 RepID=UPI0029166D8F|nr:GCN5 family acetyltransferase [Bradyrhizobium sp. SZCCHNRI1058]
MSKLRPATTTDTARCVELLRSFHGAWLEAVGSQIPGATASRLAFDPAYAERIVREHLRGGFAYALVLDVGGMVQGVLLAAAFEHGFAPVWISKETAWWIEPRHRGRSAMAMLDAYEAWARSRHCVFAGMAGMGEDPDVAVLYRRRGYTAAETHYVKAL